MRRATGLWLLGWTALAAHATAASAPKQVTLLRAGGPALGAPDAPLTIVEFTDLQCPFCRRFHLETFPRLKSEWIDPGKLRFVSRDLPVVELHPSAPITARAARCAGEQARFWEARHAFFVDDYAPDASGFASLGRALKLDVPSFVKCASDGSRFATELAQDRAEAAGLGLNSTPAFVMGRTEASGLKGELIVGAYPYSVFDRKLKALLARR